MRIQVGVGVKQQSKLGQFGNLQRTAKIGRWAAVACMSYAVASAQGPGPAVGVPPPAKTQQHSTDLPPGAGRETVMRVCSKCHSPNITVANPRNRQGWEETINKMAGLGAMATDDEFTEILEYLSKNVAPDSKPQSDTQSDTQAGAKVNVNKATSAELVAGLELTEKDAAAVVAYRTKNGDFKTIEDLRKVPDVDAKKLDDKKDKLSF